MSTLTLEQKATNHETWAHIHEVQKLLHHVMAEVARRALSHDQSKLGPPEVETFTEYTPKLKSLTYGSVEYQTTLEKMGPALRHHYRHNRHHPEHHAHGISGMTLIDLIEMLADWKAATLRHANGDIEESIDINAERFNIDPQLVSVLRRTVFFLKW